MWWAGVGWRGGDVEVAVVDGAGTGVVPTTRFAGRHVPELIALLRAQQTRSDGGLTVVLDSTNGMLVGHLLAAGLTVYRADPPDLPPRPAFGSVSGPDLAHCGATRPGVLHRLTTTTGALAGREAEFFGGIARAEPVERELTAAGRCLARGPGTGPQVALTFDDGPDPVFTAQVLEILRRYGAVGTFFCVGLNARAYPELVGRITDAGHLVGNHTWSHPYLPDLTRDELLRQIDMTDAALGTVGLVRPPYGARSPEVLHWLAGHDRTTVLWDVDVRDWALPGTAAIVAASGTASAGSVVLMHDGGGDRRQTVEALPAVIEGLLDRGYRFVTVDRLG
jgi:peptidoglycan/xylan/chitin deacetylase (PgdA/CDA1 family)